MLVTVVVTVARVIGGKRLPALCSWRCRSDVADLAIGFFCGGVVLSILGSLFAEIFRG